MHFVVECLYYSFFLIVNVVYFSSHESKRQQTMSWRQAQWLKFSQLQVFNGQLNYLNLYLNLCGGLLHGGVFHLVCAGVMNASAHSLLRIDVAWDVFWLSSSKLKVTAFHITCSHSISMYVIFLAEKKKKNGSTTLSERKS